MPLGVINEVIWQSWRYTCAGKLFKMKGATHV